MELFSLNRRELLKKFYKLQREYYSASSIDRKIYLYNHLSTLSLLLDDDTLIYNLKSSELKEYYRYEQNRRKKIYIDLSELTYELYFNWRYNVNYLNDRNKKILEKDILCKEGFYNELHDFFKNVMPSDLTLFERTFSENRILVDKRFLIEREEIYCFEALKEFYIKILYSGNITKKTVRNTVHEFGHASEFTKTNTFMSADPLMEEVIAKLYELLYVDYSFKEDKKSKYIELSNVFKGVRMCSLTKHFCKNRCNLNELLMSEIDMLYTYIISALLYLRKDNPDFYNMLEYIKANTPYLGTFDLLKNIGITENDLIDTSKNIKKLILERG